MFLVAEMQGAIFAYDLTSRASFEAIKQLLEVILRIVSQPPCTPPPDGKIPAVYRIALVGLKSDLANDQRQVTMEEGKELQERFGLLGFYEASSKMGIGVNEPFLEIIRNLNKSRSIYNGYREPPKVL